MAEPSKWLMGVYFVCCLISYACDILRPLIASFVIGALVEQNTNATYSYILLYAVVALGYRLTEIATWRLYSIEAGRDNVKIHDKVFRKIIDIDGDFTREVKKGRFMNSINGDLFNVSEIGTEMIDLVLLMVQIPVVLIIVGTYNLLFIVPIVISAVIYFKIRDHSDRKFNDLWEKKREEDDNYSGLIGQVGDGLQEVKAFNMLPRLQKKLNVIQNRYNVYYKKERYYRRVWGLDSQFSYYIFQVFLYILLTVFLMNGKIELNVLIMVVSYHQQLVKSLVGDLGAEMDQMRQRGISLKRVERILKYQPKNKKEFGRTGIEKLRGQIEFKNITLKIGQKKILNKVSFKVKPHESIAIVGFPGTGKTMILDMILRLQQPTEGKILLDNIDINEYSREIYTSSVAVANQVPFVFNLSIRDNLGFASTNIKEQIKACKIVGIHNFIETLPQGYGTILKENASNVSGGQKQMISIARAILTDAEVLLLDDITTSLDPDTATFVPRLINRLKKSHTVIVVTKKPEIMMVADRIMVLDKGKIEAIGTHKELLKESKTYRALQFAASSRGGGLR